MTDVLFNINPSWMWSQNKQFLCLNLSKSTSKVHAASELFEIPQGEDEIVQEYWQSVRIKKNWTYFWKIH